MNYNIHPIFVHFPIAFLLLYSLLKILPFRKWFPAVAWKEIQRVLLLAGVLGSFAATSTGEIAEHLTNQNHQLVETHAFFAVVSTWLYGALLLGEALSLFNSRFIKNPMATGAKLLIGIEKILTNQALAVFLAIAGAIAILMTGLLGGVMVYGTTADPLAGIVLKMLGISL